MMTCARRLITLIVALTVLAIEASAQSISPVLNPSFENGTSPWYQYEIRGNGLPTVAMPVNFGSLAPLLAYDGQYVCGMQCLPGLPKYSGVYQSFTWTAGAADIKLSAWAQARYQPFGSDTPKVRMGLAYGAVYNPTAVFTWAQTDLTGQWQTLSLLLPDDPVYTSYTLFIEGVQPSTSAEEMVTLWDNLIFIPYLKLVGTPNVTLPWDSLQSDASAIITWTTNLPCSSRVVYWGADNNKITVEQSALTTNHSIQIDHLIPSTTYTYNVEGVAAGCNSFASSESTFTTPIQITITQDPMVKADLDITISWTTDVPTNSEVNYGFDSSYGLTSVDETLTTNHQITLTNLQEASTYHYRVVSRDGTYPAAVSGDKTFVVLTAPRSAFANGTFEESHNGQSPSLYPWEKYTTGTGSSPPAIDGLIGPFPAGGPTSWYPTTGGIQAFEGSYFFGSISYGTPEKGGGYQRIILNAPQWITLCGRYATYFTTGGDFNTTQAKMGIDPTGGTDPSSSAIKWWVGATSVKTDKTWYTGGVAAYAGPGVVTLFLDVAQYYALTVHAVAFDDVTCASPVPMKIHEARNQTRAVGLKLQDKIVTWVGATNLAYGSKQYRKIYVQEPKTESCAGIAVLLDQTVTDPIIPEVGNKITVNAGVLMCTDSESKVWAYDWTVDSTAYTLPTPVAMSQASVGGNTVNQPALGRAGLCNIGTRIRLFGQITDVVSDPSGYAYSIYFDDGTGIVSPKTNVTGIKAQLVTNGTTLAVGDYITVNGVLMVQNVGSSTTPKYTYLIVTSQSSDWALARSVGS